MGILCGCHEYDIAILLIGIMNRTFGESICQQELAAMLAHRDGIHPALDLAGY
jgi:adenosine deaminase